MSRFDPEARGKNEPNLLANDGSARTVASRNARPLPGLERAFRWITEFRNEPNFELSTIELTA
jgi:hypothetical protein